MNLFHQKYCSFKCYCELTCPWTYIPAYRVLCWDKRPTNVRHALYVMAGLWNTYLCCQSKPVSTGCIRQTKPFQLLRETADTTNEWINNPISGLLCFFFKYRNKGKEKAWNRRMWKKVGGKWIDTEQQNWKGGDRRCKLGECHYTAVFKQRLVLEFNSIWCIIGWPRGINFWTAGERQLQ